MRTALFLAVLGTVCAISVMAFSKLSAEEPAEVKADPFIVSKLEEIVKISERMVRLEERKLKAGVNGDIYQSKIDLANARIGLATELRRNEEVLVALESLVTAHEAKLQWAEARAIDRTPPSDIAQLQIDHLHSQIRLARAQSAQ